MGMDAGGTIGATGATMGCGAGGIIGWDDGIIGTGGGTIGAGGGTIGATGTVTGAEAPGIIGIVAPGAWDEVGANGMMGCVGTIGAIPGNGTPPEDSKGMLVS